jgi:uncharacterized protein (DUF58 family)
MTGPARLGVIASLSELIGMRAQVRAGLANARQRPASGAATPGYYPMPRNSRGMEFSESRPYQSGDDARTLDWRQTARRGRPYTKLFQEEHERPVRLLVDLGASMRFGTRNAFKSVVAARAAALLAWCAVAGGDRLGGIISNGSEIHEVRPQGRHHGVLDLLGWLATASAAPALQTLDLALPLRALARTMLPGSRIVVISDFATLDAEAEYQIVALAGAAELLLLHVYDIFEAQAPPAGRYRLTDGQHSLNLDLRSAAARSEYGAAFAARRAALEQLARRARATLLPLATHDDPEKILAWTLFHFPHAQPATSRSAA